MQTRDVVKLVVAVLVIVGAGTLFFMRSGVDSEDYITAQPSAQETSADTAADNTSDDEKKGPPMARVGEDIG